MNSTVPKRGVWRRALSKAEIDSHVLAILLFRSWSVIAGGVTILLIPLCLTSVQQGYYFTFASILALQVFFELGLGQVIVQIVAHEAAHLQRSDTGQYLGSPEHLSRLAAMRKFLHRWYLVAAALFLIVVNVSGFLFFRGEELPWAKWAGPWSLLVLATAVNLMLAWRIAFVEGFALVRQVATLRLTQSMIGFVLMWILLVSGAGLWVVAIVPATAAVYSALWLRRRPARDVFVGHPEVQSAPGRFSWHLEVLPFQWRIAVSWISGYFIYQLFAPMIFKYHGAAEAGRVGLGITIFNSVVTVGTSWMSAKVPALAQMLSRGNSVEASRLFKRLAVTSSAFVITASCVLVCLVYLVDRLDLPIAGRIPAIPTMMFLAATAIGNSFVLSAAMFIRAHKEEPLMPSAVAMAVATSAEVYLMAPRGAVWVVGSYAVLSWIFGVVWTAILLRGYFRTPEFGT